MPMYDFRNKETDEIFEKLMSIAAKEEYLKENPHLEQIITVAGHSPVDIDKIRWGMMKPPTQWKDHLTAIKRANKGSTVNDF